MGWQLVGNRSQALDQVRRPARHHALGHNLDKITELLDHLKARVLEQCDELGQREDLAVSHHNVA